MFERRKRSEKQGELRVVAGKLPTAKPDHTNLSVTRQRLALEQMEAMHRVLLRALHAHGLLRGRKLGIDSGVIETNASLWGLEHRNAEESYWEYVMRLAAEAGSDPAHTKAVRRLDKTREGRKTSNRDWQKPHDPEAKVGRIKDGARDMVDKPGHITDLGKGAISAPWPPMTFVSQTSATFFHSIACAPAVRRFSTGC